MSELLVVEPSAKYADDVDDYLWMENSQIAYFQALCSFAQVVQYEEVDKLREQGYTAIVQHILILCFFDNITDVNSDKEIQFFFEFLICHLSTDLLNQNGQTFS